jgi:hypothetical protein
MSERLTIIPMTLEGANLFVERHHRHSVPTVGHKFSIGCCGPDWLVIGVGIVGRPVARGLDDGWCLEALRVCTDGTKNACSMLYAACWRATRAMGYRKLITYSLKTEPGTSLVAAGFRIVGEVSRRSWDTPTRPRVDRDERQERFRWEIAA